MKKIILVSIITVSAFAGISTNFDTYDKWYNDKSYTKNYDSWKFCEVINSTVKDGYIYGVCKLCSDNSKIINFVQKPVIKTNETIKQGYVIVVPIETK